MRPSLIQVSLIALFTGFGASAHEICRQSLTKYLADGPAAEAPERRKSVLMDCAKGRSATETDKLVKKLVAKCGNLTRNASSNPAIAAQVEKCQIDAYRYVLWFEY